MRSTTPELALEQVLWRDASFDGLKADYDEIVVEATDAAGRAVRLRAGGHIELAWYGHWDENILEDVNVTTDSPLIARALERVRAAYGEAPSPGGGVRHLSGRWYALNLRFIDGAAIEIVASTITLEIAD